MRATTITCGACGFEGQPTVRRYSLTAAGCCPYCGAGAEYLEKLEGES